MSTAQGRRYRHVGVFIPVQTREDNPDRVEREWPRITPAHVASKGFLLARTMDTFSENLVTIEQSVQTGELLAHKLLRTQDLDYPQYEDPPELRVSTWQGTLPSTEFPNDFPLGVLPRKAPFFNKLKFWQELVSEGDNAHPAYSLYFELVAEQLCLAVAWLHFGERPNVGGHSPPANWNRIYHRDMNASNVFINYPPFKGGRVPAAGQESNAFPQIVLGDFGFAALGTDDPEMVPPDPLGEVEPEDTFLDEVDDTWLVGDTLRRLCQAHFPPIKYDGLKSPNKTKMADVNARDASVPDYSDELVDLLGKFEWEGMEDQIKAPMDEPPVATSRWIVDTLYPAARDRVRAYRRPPGPRPPAGYFDALDVSWTRPEPEMPFMYNTRYAAAAEDADGDQEGEDDGDDGEDKDANSEVARMQKLRELHKWNDVKPRYELRSLEFGCPTMKPLRDQPPGADDGSDDEDA